MTTMQAIQINRYGGVDELVQAEIARPEPTADQVLIKVHAIGINPVDYKVRSGMIAFFDEQAFPVALGWDVAGTIAAVGSNVSQWKLGDEVYGMVNFPTPSGAYAEYVVAPALEVAAKPKSLSFAEAAAVPLVALTAWQAFDLVGLQAGDRVLVHAAAGGVGHVAVQLAKLRGAHVIATASARNEGFVRELGVDQFVDYTAAPFEQQIEPVDVVFDTVGGEVQARSYAVLKPQAGLVTIVGSPPADLAAAHAGKSLNHLVQANQAQLTEIANLIDSQKLRVEVEQVYDFTAMAAAHERMQSSRVRGKIVVKVS
ncbi:NADP-dependent oxidoreductase [Herpetosiphon sp.]|uniref:Alcohol dehydrogenase GroES domain protein n=1 Tax=Herpetosiphon aurantiacus (strain ATCC 23779 / DSM 785 / 114-95) TaxID=316274 RepID=A9AUU0_HERA2|nr:NADP-dependent oxidoreductase [Herpetosiphon sp.]ABX06528.1 Alcohol dehydrogenase GroES domain protein [Herpetosiphon aurantiacus DSM 785]